MTISKHTPGPWDYDVCDFGNGQVEYGIFNPAQQVEGDTVEYIATVHDKGAEQDARLIAAAPELLAACQSVLDEFPALDSKRIESVKAICRAAIAKATGESA